MPISASPNRGYADWQRVSNWDSGVLWAPAAGVGNVLVISPVLDVSRFAYLGGALNTATGLCWVTFTWYVNAQQTAIVSSRNFVLSPSMGNSCQLRIPNLGPYLQIGANPVAGANFQLTGQILGTNRVHPLEFIPAAPVLINALNRAIGAGATVDVYPSDYYAGPVRVSGFSPVAGVWFQIMSLQGDGSTTLVDVMIPAANAQTTWSAVVPPGAWKVSVFNSGGAATNFYLRVAYSSTGSL